MSQAQFSMDPVCGMQVDAQSATHTSTYQGRPFAFCSAGCKRAFDANPAKYLGGGYRPSMLGAMLGRVRGLFGGK